jgi:hypothetical protein
LLKVAAIAYSSSHVTRETSGSGSSRKKSSRELEAVATKENSYFQGDNLQGFIFGNVQE